MTVNGKYIDRTNYEISAICNAFSRRFKSAEVMLILSSLYVRAKHMTAFEIVSNNSAIVASGFTCMRTNSVTHAFLIPNGLNLCRVPISYC